MTASGTISVFVLKPRWQRAKPHSLTPVMQLLGSLCGTLYLQAHAAMLRT